MENINRQSYLREIGARSIGGVTAGHLGGEETGVLATYVPDQPGIVADLRPVERGVADRYVPQPVGNETEAIHETVTGASGE